MEKNFKQLEKNYIYYVLAIYIFSLFIYNTCLETSIEIVSKATRIIRYSCYILFIVYNIINFLKDKKISWNALIFFTVAVLIALSARNNEILFIALLLYTVKDLNYRKIIKIGFYIYSISFLFTIIFSLLGIIPDWTYKRGEIIRHSLGFYYATSTISVFLLIVLMYFYIRKSNFNYLELIAIETINVFLYKYTDGRLGFILITIILLFMIISKMKMLRRIFLSNKFLKILKKVSYILPILLLVLMIFFIIAYANNLNFAKNINEILSQRLKWSHNAFQKYPIKLFGTDIEWVGHGGQGYVSFEQKAYNYVDSSYIKIIFDYGIIGSIIIMYMYTKALINSLNKKDYYLYCTLIFILIWSFIEPYMFNIGRNVFIITFSFIFNERCINIENLRKNIKTKNING